MAEGFVRHKQPWTSDEIQKLHRLAAKGMALKAMGKALTRSEESIQARAKQDGHTVGQQLSPLWYGRETPETEGMHPSYFQ